jgi:methyl-accepting chemotaxis protein
MSDVTKLVEHNTSNVIEVNQSIAEAHREATEGGRIVDDAVAAMTNIQNSSQEITQIINVIDGIAFQTNLLALNAGVEAARAGARRQGLCRRRPKFAPLPSALRTRLARSGTHQHQRPSRRSGVDLVGATGKALARS